MHVTPSPTFFFHKIATNYIILRCLFSLISQELSSKLKEGKEQLDIKNDKLVKASESSSANEKTLVLEEKSQLADQVLSDLVKICEEVPQGTDLAEG